MSEIRTFKELESKVQEEMFNNIYLLKRFYKTSQEFDHVFKKDMFIKNNKAAFYEVVYYLLNILDPDLTKKKLTTWPPFEIKRENKFRSELLKYINELNSIYKHANIPPIMPSHLISPGGFKIAKFILKLSQLVIFEHLNKINAGLLLYCPIPNKDTYITERMLNNLNKMTLEIETRTKAEVEKFQEYQNEQKNAANILVDKLSELDKSISVAKKEQTIAEEEFYKKYTLYPSMNSLKEKFTSLKQHWSSVSSVHDIFTGCKSLLSYLSENNLVLEHTLEDQKTPEENKLVLSKFFNQAAIIISNKSLELPNPSSSYIQQNSKKIQSITDKYVQMHKDTDTSKQQTCLLIKYMFENLKYVDNLISLHSKTDNLVDSPEDTFGIKPLDYSDN